MSQVDNIARSIGDTGRLFRVQRLIVSNYEYRYREPIYYRMNVLVREFFLCFWKIHILHHAAERPIYGQWMIEELREHGYAISPGTLYPILQRMKEYGWLKSTISGDHPRARRNYRLTPEGEAVLKQVREHLDELNKELREQERKDRTRKPRRITKREK